jgi:diacylglycerol kinase (ATP)
MRRQNIIEAFNSALEGLIYVVKTERNMRIHFLIAAVAVLLGIYLNFSGIEFLLLLTAVTFVLLSEMVNTAVEHTIDLISNEFHHLARIIKDISAGAVLLASFNAAITGYILFRRNLFIPWHTYMIRVKETPWHVTLIVLIAVFGLVIIAKVLMHRGTPLRGGMPSGHAAVAFAIWAVIAFHTPELMIVLLTLLLAVLVARSRVTQKVHNVWEVTAGAALGALAATLMMQVLL